MAHKLTKDADRLICLLYKSYLEKRKNGEIKSSARFFGNSDAIREAFLPSWSSNDVADECWGLCRIGIIDCSPGDDMANDVRISDAGILYMESRFSNEIKEIVSYISALKPY